MMPETHDLEVIERELRGLVDSIVYPPTPPLAAAVRRSIEAAAQAPRRAPVWRLVPLRGLAAALAVALLAFALTLGLSAGARQAVADFFGLGNVRFFRTEEAPEGLPSEITGTPVALSEAEDLAGFPVRLPTYPPGIGQPDRVLFQRFGERPVVIILYEGREPPFAVYQTTAFFGKGLPFEAELEAVTVAGSAGYWLRGGRILEFYDEQGNVVTESRRVADANTLIWQIGDVAYRLEGDLSLADAVKIAQSLR